MVSRRTENWINGMLTSATGLKNMYKYGASITSILKLLLAYAGLYGHLLGGNWEQANIYLRALIGSALPPYLALNGGFVGFIDFLTTSFFLIAIGITVAAANYEESTRRTI